MFRDKKFKVFAVAVILGVFSLSAGFTDYGQRGCGDDCMPYTWRNIIVCSPGS